MYRGKLPPEEKIAAVKLYLNGKGSIHQIARMYGVGKPAVRKWVRNYESVGVEAFNTKKNKKYSAEVKQEAVREYLSGRGSLPAVCKKYGIRSGSVLGDWIKVYSRHGTLKSSFHSDRGFQYTNRVFHTMLEDAGMTQSMSRIGKPIHGRFPGNNKA